MTWKSVSFSIDADVAAGFLQKPLCKMPHFVLGKRKGLWPTICMKNDCTAIRPENALDFDFFWLCRSEHGFICFGFYFVIQWNVLFTLTLYIQFTARSEKKVVGHCKASLGSIRKKMNNSERIALDLKCLKAFKQFPEPPLQNATLIQKVKLDLFPNCRSIFDFFNSWVCT